MRNLRITLEYDGTRYVGWQRQPNGTSIQGCIESALLRLLQEEVNVIGAGRTDAGVHARGQVANFRTLSDMPLPSVRSGLNALLPEDIVVSVVEEASLDFHARYSARERIYTYHITLRPLALTRNFHWYVKYDLDPGLMRRAAGLITGLHDFTSFCRAQAEVDHHRCDVRRAEWCQDDSTLRFTIAADRFLHGMVRALVGTMVDVGRGYTTLEAFAGILACRDRTKAGMAAPPGGLVLESVLY